MDDQPARGAAPEGPSGARDERLLLPSRVGDYHLGAAIAAGGCGAVHHGAHVTRGDEVAIKILHPHLAWNETALRRFEREVDILRRVRHPSLVELRDAGRCADGRPYFVMELLRGATLADHLRRRGPLPIDEAIAVLAPLCDALGAAHAQGVIHRDVKPSNVFLADDRGAPRVVLLDFGIAKLLGASAALTAPRHAVGTMVSMAPEQILGGEVDARADVYALGVLVYRLLTGLLPFNAQSPRALRYMHLHARPRRPSACASVDPAVDDAVLRAMSKSPAERQPTPAAFLASVGAALDRGIAPRTPVKIQRAVE